ncbi:MAG: cysteine synthase CysM [Lentisphaeraceae bacterium]|nr:cysteine synthase CysM [Lentisphaeraceae bacterium]
MKLTDLVGNTPMVRLERLCTKPNIKFYVKLEGTNPGGSVKDRAALYMIKGAEERGELKPGVRIIEPTSGNTGIALAMIALSKGYEMELVMPASATKERVMIMEAYGAKVTLTPAKQSMEGAIDYARAQVEKGGCIMLNQFGNPDNPLAHYSTTAPEIWKDTEGKVTHFVSSMGTTGTIMGVSKYLKEQSKDVQIVGVQPDSEACIPGIRRWPKEYLPAVFEADRVDRVIDVTQQEAEEVTRKLCSQEGIFCGMSAGGAVAAALRLTEELDEGVIVVIIPDRGDKYLSTDLFNKK